MDNIVELRAVGGRARFLPEVPAGGASILLFTGIRYERDIVAEPSPADAFDEGGRAADRGASSPMVQQSPATF